MVNGRAKVPKEDIRTSQLAGIGTRATPKGDGEVAAAGKPLGEEKVFPHPPESVKATLSKAKAAHLQANEAHSQAKEAHLHQESPDPLSSLAPFERLRGFIGWWETHAPQFVLNLISRGVEPSFPNINLPTRVQKKSKEETQLALKVMM